MRVSIWRNGTLLKEENVNLLNGLLNFALDYLAFGAMVEHTGKNYICLRVAMDTIFFDGNPSEIGILNKCANKYSVLWDKLGDNLHTLQCDNVRCASEKLKGSVFWKTEKLFARCAVMYTLKWKKNTICTLIDENFFCEDFKKFVRRIEMLGMDTKSSLILVRPAKGLQNSR